MAKQQQEKRQFHRPQGIIIIAALTILSGLYGLAILGLPAIYQGHEEHIIQDTWAAGIGVSEIIIGIFTFRGKGGA